MARVVVLGAGISGHTAASFARSWLGKQHEVVVISPNSQYNWIPSNIWVGVGKMPVERVVRPLAPIYEKAGIEFRQALCLSVHPEGHADSADPYVTIRYTDASRQGQEETIRYDYLVNATGPKLKFEATEGLGPGKNSLSVCTPGHALEASAALDIAIERMKKGERQRFLVGTGHGSATCQGAAFEYIFNLEFELERRGVRDKADLTWISNEYELGDFGMGGMHLRRGGYVTHSKIFAESLFAERGLDWITRAAVQQVDPGQAHYLTLKGEQGTQDFDFAMLIPAFSGVGLKAFAKDGSEITSNLFNPGGFMLVDGDYSKKPYEEWDAEDWPKLYQSPAYGNLFACGIAFAPPHAISKPMTSTTGVPIFPAPPRTGMPSATIGKAVAKNIVGMIGGAPAPTHKASMARMGAACVASAGANPFSGTAASITVFPIIPDFKRFPETGRDTRYTFGEIGLAGHWIKNILHHVFLYKAQLKPGWKLIPE